jgi:hypothetical protein
MASLSFFATPWPFSYASPSANRASTQPRSAASAYHWAAADGAFLRDTPGGGVVPAETPLGMDAARQELKLEIVKMLARANGGPDVSTQ